jgi:hypothetical protein
MDIHHNTSSKFILEDGSISLASKACIHSCSGKGVGLWLVVRPSICSFCITHFIFTSTLCFHLGLIQPLIFSFLTCECDQKVEHIWHTLNLFVWRSTNNHTWRHSKHHVCFRTRKRTCCMEKMVVHPYVMNFIMNQSLHDPRRLGLHCQCGGYWPNAGDSGFECH